MGFDRDRLPDPASYYESQGLHLKGPPRSKWRTTACQFHGGSDSMRINTESGGFCCMACDARGGDVLSYHMQATGQDFATAARDLGAWIDDGKPQRPQRPTSLPPRAALEVLRMETLIVAIEAGRMAKGHVPTEADKARLLLCANRINRIAEEYRA